jgi:SH3-like domain-containing protein
MRAMKRILLFFSCLVFLLSGESAAERLSVVANESNIRSGPSKDHQILWSAGKYYPVDVIEKSGSWYKIKDFEGDQGWIHKSLLEKVPTVIVKVSLANIREAPEDQARIVFQAEKGVSMKQLSVKGKWLKVQHADGDVGWINDSLVWGR